IKNDPPFTYKGEIQASTFKHWCHEIWNWVQRGCLSERVGIELSGKYLAGSAYQFYECDILDLGQRYTLTEYFKHLFDYIFPADFWMQQRDKFDTCEQQEWSVMDFLCCLHELADYWGSRR
ncbi:hypothetical protein P691DRAFT_687412, partial [Macrolepiota fuliginosa MF-IS2]